MGMELMQMDLDNLGLGLGFPSHNMIPEWVSSWVRGDATLSHTNDGEHTHMIHRTGSCQWLIRLDSRLNRD